MRGEPHSAIGRFLFECYGWIIVAWRFIRYFVHRWCGIGPMPIFTDVYQSAVFVFDTIMGWRRRLRSRQMDHIPPQGPAIFVGNHIKADDPFVMYRSIHRQVHGAYPVRFMMRNDFFSGLGRGKWRWIDVDELAVAAGALLISRGKPKLSQLKPFVELLKTDQAFIMYPSGSRSRTGIFFEYRDGADEPGGVAFFIAQVQRKRPEPPVPMIPVTRTPNLITGKSVVVFGAPEYLPPKSRRKEQRAVDYRLVERLGALVELNVPHLVSGLLYLAALHDRGESYSVESLTEAVRHILDAEVHPIVDPAALEDTRGEVKRTLAYFAKAGLLRVEQNRVCLDREKVLAAPAWEKAYRKLNPIKYQLNQILHLGDVVEALEGQSVISQSS